MMLRFCSSVLDKSIYRKDTSQSESISKLNAKHAFYLFYNKSFFLRQDFNDLQQKLENKSHSLLALSFNCSELVRLESKSVAHTVCGNCQRGIVTVNLNHHLKEPRVTKREASGHTCGGLLGSLQQAKETHFNCGHGHPCGVWWGGPRLEKTEKASYFQASKLTASWLWTWCEQLPQASAAMPSPPQ